MLEYWSNALSRIDPTLHDSTTPCFHLITLSTLASTMGGIVTLICFAVLRLITSILVRSRQHSLQSYTTIRLREIFDIDSNISTQYC
jgi:hypothetical protein